MKKLFVCIVLVFIVLTIVGCAAGPNTAQNTPSPDKKDGVAGFWQGLWHGIIAPVTFIISLFSKGLNVYEVHNNGGWYNLGFVIGAGILFGGGCKASCKKND
jgi:hypothetical protein